MVTIVAIYAFVIGALTTSSIFSFMKLMNDKKMSVKQKTEQLKLEAEIMKMLEEEKKIMSDKQMSVNFAFLELDRLLGEKAKIYNAGVEWIILNTPKYSSIRLMFDEPDFNDLIEEEAKVVKEVNVIIQALSLNNFPFRILDELKDTLIVVSEIFSTDVQDKASKINSVVH